MLAAIDFSEVKKVFWIYEAFMAQPKNTEIDPVVLAQPTPKLEYFGESGVQMGWAGFICQFQATRSPKLNMKYGMIIRVPFFHEKPCFRFCSSGRAHTNPEMGDGLPAREIPTPHFHRVDSRGILMAYQPAPLLDPEECGKIASNPQLGANLFCQEANLFSPNGGFVALKTWATELDMSTDDPLDGANFPP